MLTNKPFPNVCSGTLMKEASEGISFKFTTSTKNTLCAKQAEFSYFAVWKLMCHAKRGKDFSNKIRRIPRMYAALITFQSALVPFPT